MLVKPGKNSSWKKFRFILLFLGLQASLNTNFLLVNPLAPPPFPDERLYKRAEFAISLCTEEGMFNTTETAACSLFEFFGTLNVVYSPVS